MFSINMISCEETKRRENFSSAEINLLIELVKKYKNIIENKKSDAVTWREKEKGWELLTAEFNTMNPKAVKRTVKNLKGKWDNLKKLTKKKFAAQKLEIYKTGGGYPIEVPIASWENEVKEIIGIAVTGLPSSFDSDCLLYSNEEQQQLRDHDYLIQNGEGTVKCLVDTISTFLNSLDLLF